MADILVVDDSRIARAMVRQALDMHGHAVHEADSVQHALDLIAHQHVDLVLVDWNMPGGNGLELVHLLRAEPRTANTPIVFATSEADPRRMGYAHAAGADGYLVKPFNAQTLMRVVDPLLNRP